jgi:hypothetical protein
MIAYSVGKYSVEGREFINTIDVFWNDARGTVRSGAGYTGYRTANHSLRRPAATVQNGHT